MHMGKNKGPGGPPAVSKFRAKRIAQEKGERALFEFKDRPAPPQKPPVSAAQKAPAPVPPAQKPAPPAIPLVKAGETKVLRAKVRTVAGALGAVFLESAEGHAIFLSFRVLQRGHGSWIDKGSIVEGEVEQHPNGKGPRMVRIVSVSPPPA